MRSPVSWIEISKSAFFHNITQYKKIIGSGQFAAVIKSNAYGHDQLLIAQLCESTALVDWLCVANLSDAISLRTHGITKPILVLTNLDDDLTLAAVYDIDFICYEKEVLEKANALGKAVGKKMHLHIKVDTGVSRFGLMPDECLSFLRYAAILPHIVVRGIFTHFAQAQQEEASFTLEQYGIFDNLLAVLEQERMHIPYRHCANTAATSTLPIGRCNFFRVGAGMYGIWPSQAIRNTTIKNYPDFSLKNMLTWKALVLSTRTIQAGCTVGYDRTYTTPRPTTIALLPIGYYEGYDRRLSNTGMVLLQGKIAPVIGRICMNVMMVDVTDIPQTVVGDTVVIVADHPCLHPTTIANSINSFNPREILARLHPALPRILVD